MQEKWRIRSKNVLFSVKRINFESAEVLAATLVMLGDTLNAYSAYEKISTWNNVTVPVYVILNVSELSSFPEQTSR